MKKLIMLKHLMTLLLGTFVLFGCDNKKETKSTTDFFLPEIKVEKKIPISYTFLISKDSIKKFIKDTDSNNLKIIGAINRVDVKFLNRFDSIIIPSDLTQSIKQYFPFPFEASFLKGVKKIIFFSYPTQSFAAYENGILVYTGPTSMGRKADMTPTGLFYTNWKAEQTTSTFNDEWDLKWNFNIENKLGVGFHQYEMPGYPASHSCLRLTEKDAKYLYEWADQWKIKGTDNILAQGTPVVVYGAYPFGRSKPWLAVVQNEKALDISNADLESITQQFLPDIMQKQAQRDSIK
jgi:hypothetical protein